MAPAAANESGLEQMQTLQELAPALLVGGHRGVDLRCGHGPSVPGQDARPERAVGTGDQPEPLDDVLLALSPCGRGGGLVGQRLLQFVQIGDLMLERSLKWTGLALRVLAEALLVPIFL